MISSIRPFITKPFRRAAFNSVYRLLYPWIKATKKLVKQRFVWPSINRDCKHWAQACIEYQRAAITCHVSAPLSSFFQPSQRFEHVHVDLIVMSYSDGFRYCLTCIRQIYSMLEVIILENQEATTVVEHFIRIGSPRFGKSLRITTDQGRLFELCAFQAFKLLDWHKSSQDYSL